MITVTDPPPLCVCVCVCVCMRASVHVYLKVQHILINVKQFTKLLLQKAIYKALWTKTQLDLHNVHFHAHQLSPPPPPKKREKKRKENKTSTALLGWLLESADQFCEICDKPVSIVFHFVSHNVPSVSNESILKERKEEKKKGCNTYVMSISKEESAVICRIFLASTKQLVKHTYLSLYIYVFCLLISSFFHLTKPNPKLKK